VHVEGKGEGEEGNSMGGLLGNLLFCIGGREETRRPFIASIQTSQLGVRGGEGRWTRLESRSAVGVWGGSRSV
jgi:hypothetical protein